MHTGSSGCSETGTAVSITESEFIDDGDAASADGAGGAAYIEQGCGKEQTVLRGDTFEGNTLSASGTGQFTGAGLSIFIDTVEQPAAVIQSGNIFDSNVISSGGAEANYGGGGEWVQGADLTSQADRFSRNSVVGTNGKHWSWGAGLGILNQGCNESSPTESTLEDDVVAANVLQAGTESDLGGAGIYIGCGYAPGAHNHLQLLDSTVTENAVATAGGVPGIAGHEGDQLVVANSIVAGNLGGPTLGGFFTGAGGLAEASYSDLCNTAGSGPLAGTGNICAAPKLADEGDPSSYDVHETAASPTIDAGSNALVPAGLGKRTSSPPRGSWRASRARPARRRSSGRP